jgi:hypothetical protein
MAPALAADPYKSDRPLLSRYQGSMLYMDGEASAASAQMLFEEKGKPVLRPLEGRISNRLYWGPMGRSPLELYRNYRHALEAAGFQVM